MRVSTENPKVILRPWTSGDYGSLVRYGNNRNVWRNLTDMFPHPYTHADAVAWVAIAGAPSPSIHLAIDLSGEAIGGAGVVAQEEGIGFHTGLFGYWLGQPHWGQGIATAVARALKAHAFAANPRFNRLEAQVLAWNTPSMRVLEKAGFQREGILRKRALKDAELVDCVMYAAIRDE